MIGYSFLPQSYTYVPSAFQQSFAGSSNYHQSLADVLPQYKSSVSASNLPASGYGGFGNNSTIPGNYSSGTSLSYDEVLSSQYKDNSSHLLSLQQKENSAMWLHGNSRTMPAVPGSTYYNYQTQNQQLGGFRQVQQQSQNYWPSGNPNFYQIQAGISLDQQQQNPRDLSLGGSQEQPKQSQILPNNYLSTFWFSRAAPFSFPIDGCNFASFYSHQ
ncbi:Kinase-related protein of unknown function (DUF1296 [Striga hermonthica]|uniref:Uncharacterized protein n=1 Tax=Striga hermonthica TaxID=68872 RepID=A0A9N7N9Y5_STRHE|nr:Kinase-related protein of unknown function (DUF1296 [Striga hermonthica]